MNTIPSETKIEPQNTDQRDWGGGKRSIVLGGCSKWVNIGITRLTIWFIGFIDRLSAARPLEGLNADAHTSLCGPYGPRKALVITYLDLPNPLL